MRFGGLAVGKVTRVRVDPANSTRIEIAIAVSKDAPLKTDSVAKITTLGPLTDNYIEISTGSEGAAPAQPGSTLQSTEAFGLPQLSDAAQTMVPEIQKALQKLNQNLDGLQVTVARANDLLNDGNRKNIASSLSGIAQTVAEARPKVVDSLDNLNGMLTDARPKVSASLTNVQQLTAKLDPVLDDLKTDNRPRQRHVGSRGCDAGREPPGYSRVDRGIARDGREVLGFARPVQSDRSTRIPTISTACWRTCA